MKVLTPATTSPAGTLPSATAPEASDPFGPGIFELSYQALADRAQYPIDALSTTYVWRVYPVAGGSGPAAALNVGQAVCLNTGDGTVALASTSNLANCRMPLGIVVGAANGANIPVAISGLVPTSITSLGAGTGGELVRVNPTGETALRGASGGVDYILGRANTVGALVLAPSLLDYTSGYIEVTSKTTTSGTLEDITGATFTLGVVSGRIQAIMTVQCTATGGACTGGWAISINSVDGTEIARYLSATNDTGSVTVQARSAALSAGTYTVKGRHRRVSGANTVNSDVVQLSAHVVAV